jgi:hypothetical protein
MSGIIGVVIVAYEIEATRNFADGKWPLGLVSLRWCNWRLRRIPVNIIEAAIDISDLDIFAVNTPVVHNPPDVTQRALGHALFVIAPKPVVFYNA